MLKCHISRQKKKQIRIKPTERPYFRNDTTQKLRYKMFKFIC